MAHVMVRSAEDTFIDADGARSLVEIMADAGVDPHGGEEWEVREIAPDVLLNWANGRRLPIITKAMASQAKQWAAEVVATLGIPSQLMSPGKQNDRPEGRSSMEQRCDIFTSTPLGRGWGMGRPMYLDFAGISDNIKASFSVLRADVEEI